ncbi:hypothetical protein ABPG73_018029 [Tetrahymena malaccensis]
MDIENNLQSGKYQPHPESIPVNIHTYGFGGVRYDNIILLSEDEALIPAGVCLAKWDIKRGRRIGLVQTNNDSIFVLLECGMYIISISYSGQVSIVDRKGLNILRQFQTKGRIVRHASVNNQYLSISCEEYKDQKGITIVYLFEQLMNSPAEDTDKFIHLEIVGRYRFGTLTENGLLVTFLEKLLLNEQKQDLNVNQQKMQDEEQVKAKKQKKGKKHVSKHHRRFYDLIQFDLNTKQQTLQQSCPYVCDLISGTSNGNSTGSFLYQDRHLIIIDLQTLKILTFTNIGGGKGSIMTQTYTDKSTLLLSPASNYLLYIDCNKLQEKELPKEIIGNQEGQFDGYSVQVLKSRAAHPENYYIKLFNNYLFASNEGGFIQQNLQNLKDCRSISGMNITCCGLATNPTEQMVAVGDFLGNVYIYPAEMCVDNDAIFQTSVLSGIRSLDWDDSGMFIAIGTMEGSIYRWYFQDYTAQPQLIANLKGSITSLRFKQENENQYLLAATTEGQFAIFQDNFGQNMITKVVFYGHLPQDSSDRFGSLDIFAEIWSCIWNCNNSSQIATCSEDQTVHIFDLKNKQPLQTHELKGHTLAVTSVDWKKMNEALGEVFISCSDDQTIRVYNPQNNFELVHEFSTSFVREWHTLTYLALEDGGTRVAIGSQNGYFFIYDLLEKQFKYSEKIHMGGIEGLVWKKSKIFTCSSDCCINVIQA